MKCQFHFSAKKSDDKCSTRNQVKHFKYSRAPIKWPPIQRPPPIMLSVIKVPKVVFWYNAANIAYN